MEGFNFFHQGTLECNDLGLCATKMGLKLNHSNIISYVKYNKVNKTG